MEKKHRGLSVWELTMMALGTVIGGSFFLGSSVAIHAVGPLIIISYVLGGILVYFILSALSEMTVADPAPGSFRTFAGKAFGPGAGFIVGWVYWTGMVLAMSSEAAAVSILLRKWFPGISISLFGSMTILAVTLLNLLGANKLSKLESGLAAVKLLTIISFIIIALLLISGFLGVSPRTGTAKVTGEPLLLGGVKSIAGSMLTVMFAYAGFEIIGLAASETDNPKKIIPKAISYTVISLVGLYIASISALLLLIPTGVLSENFSPMVAALNRWGMNWAGNVINIVMVTAILSTMLAAMFGIGRMIRSLADESYAPRWLKDRTKVPYRGMVFSGFVMFLGLMLGLLFPRVYLFLVSCGGFALLFTYVTIVASQIRLRKKHTYGAEGRHHIYVSWITLISLIIVIASMPFIPGQASGLIAGLIIIAFYSVVYMCMKYYIKIKTYGISGNQFNVKRHNASFFTEFSKELIEKKKKTIQRYKGK
ncbi:amino acid permease [Clostridium sp. WILCCON 0269]|uniref:Amino acid permease n=1 Tax=Candidatus Clostridium eludens TaxID=3381663 RepID=A0ABW8SN30_9CLOT